MQDNEIVSCPKCRAEFECKVGTLALCHCSQLPLSQEQQKYIAERWQGCLCHNCLLEIQSQRMTP